MRRVTIISSTQHTSSQHTWYSYPYTSTTKSQISMSNMLNPSTTHCQYDHVFPNHYENPPVRNSREVRVPPTSSHHTSHPHPSLTNIHNPQSTYHRSTSPHTTGHRVNNPPVLTATQTYITETHPSRDSVSGSGTVAPSQSHSPDRLAI